ncbi:PREDICTED: serine protease nudel [Bactrocera latifrons]|uniref:serine protease nudel n=1 Tax=Bactrocera latifrons TaxID=174628 RepID=UPI0008DCF017|nr:PREDICTED: serine protease nudel [Bactrocera latifrons]
MAKTKLFADDIDVCGPRYQRKCLKTLLFQILAISGIALLVVFILLVYHAIRLDSGGKHRNFDTSNSQHQKILNNLPYNHLPRDEAANSPTSNYDYKITNKYDRTLDVQHLRSSVSYHRRRRTLPDMLDPLFLERGPNFDRLYTKVRDKRTRKELGELEKEYFRCKKESVKSSSCMVSFLKLYNLAKEISEKMDKMKEIFNDNEETRTQSKSSDSKESKELKEDVHKGANSKEETAPKTESSLATVTDGDGFAQRNSSTKEDEEQIHFSWIIDGQHDNSEDKDTTKESTSGTTPSILPKSTAVREVSPTATDSTQRTVTLNKNLANSTNHGTESAQTEIPKKHNDTSFAHTENESHKISWILDGFESDNETVHVDKTVTLKTNAEPSEKNKTTEFAEHTSATTQATKTIVDDKPEKISWIIDGHHEEDEGKEDKPKNTTQPSLSKELTSSITEKISWILDETEIEETTPKATSKSTMKIEDKPDRISWIIDGNDDHIVTTSTSRTTSTSTRDIFEELEAVTEAVEKEEDKLRKLKYDSIVEEVNKSYEQYKNDTSTTTLPRGHSTPYLVMNQTVILTNTTGIMITYGGDCVTTRKPDIEHEKARTGGNDRSHPLDYPSSLENMLDSSEKQHGFKHIEQDILWPNIKNSTPTTSAPYDPKVWEELFRKTSVVQHQRDELIDTFEIGDIDSMMKFGAKLNSANTNTFQDAQFLSLCDQVARRLHNKGAYTVSDSFTPAPSSQFTSRGPGGFPVTGETMKATAQFLYNPNFGMPTIPICFYITPANFRVSNQHPMWTPNFQGMPVSYTSGPMSFNTPNGVFFVPQNVGPTGSFFGQTGGTGNGGQSNMGNLFTKNAAPRKQQQQFFCTYMQNNANNSPSGTSGGGLGSSFNVMGFRNGSFKMRTSAQNLSSDIIYASYTNIPDHLGHVDHFQCPSPEQTGCYGGKECIQKSAWCDGYVDCSDGSDEAACRCIDRLASKRICDGYADCPMGEDELGCFGCSDLIYSCYGSSEEYTAFNRSTVSMCYSATEKCDGVMNCLNGRDELECNIIVKDVSDHMSHAVSSSSGFLFHNYRGEWYPVCNNAQKWANEACASEAEHSAIPNVTFRAITLPGPFIEPTLVGQAHFPQSCQQRDVHDNLVDQAAYVNCSSTMCGFVKKKTVKAFRRKRSRALTASQTMKKQQQRGIFNGRIVGGSYSAPMQWPFVVAIYRDGKFHCGGTIYNENWILSAAHCVINYHKYYYEIYAGLLRRTSFSSSTQIRAVSHITVHQAYERRSMRNDLSLLRMSESLNFNRWVKPICLPDMGRTTVGEDWIWGPEENTLCTVVGWGAVREKGPGSDQLREVVVPIRKQCKELDDRRSEDVCAGDSGGGRDACQGDSGGPLFCRSANNTEEWYLAGVVSHGNGCARPDEFGAYTRVALFLDWIEMATKFLAKLRPRLTCPGYICVWGGKRCIPKKQRCDRVVHCLGGEDEVGCTYNFIPDMVGSSINATATTESDYYPENLVTLPYCKAADTERQARVESEENEDNTTAFTTEVPTISEITKTDSVNSTEFGKTETITTESGIEETTINQTTTKESNTSEANSAKPTTTEISTTESTTESETTLWTAADTPIISPSTTEVITTTTVVSTTEISTTVRIETTEMSTTETTTETTTPSKITTESLTPFDIENLVTTQPTDATLSPTHKPDTTQTSKKIANDVTLTSETSNDSTTSKPKKFSNTTMPGKFVCQRIPQIVEFANRCDRVLDCEDGTDEESCTCRDYLKGSLNILICDGKVDCEDFTDEENCGDCNDSEFLCPLSKICVPLQKRCDDTIDCAFKEDEKDCFALTNGKKIVLDADRRPVLNNAGIFSRNTYGKWRVVCSHEIPFSEKIFTTAENVCAQLGFKSLKFYNTTKFITHDSIVPIHPDIQKKTKNLRIHFSAIEEDNHHFSNTERQFRVNDQAFKARTQFIEHVKDECFGLFVECEAKAYKVEPIKTVSAGDEVSPSGLPSSVLQPDLETHGKPNVFVTPPSTSFMVKKKDEVLDKLDGLLKNHKNMTLLIDNKLHEAVEELHWPWVVDVYVDGRLWCVGALVDKYWVLVHESCHYGVRFNANYIAALLGGSKTKSRRHKSTHEQIRRVDCFEQVAKSDVLLYHLEKPVRFTHHVLPTFLPDFAKNVADESYQCIAILHDEQSGRIKAVSAIEERNDALCKVSDTSCFRLIEHKPPRELIGLGLSDEDFASLSEELKEDLDKNNDSTGSTISRFTTCTQFGKKNISRTALEPVDQGILSCRKTDSGWFPLALFDYNNTNCYSFKDSFALRTLERVYGEMQKLIDQSKCEHSNGAPVCSTFRCMLGDCLEEEQICNGMNDCHDGADEEKEMCSGRKKVCQPSEMKCRSTYKCIPKTKFCDHIADCDDMTDEPTLCSCYTYLQATDPKKICDGIRNCWDKSDESPAICNCTANHFPCGASSNECVPRDFVCDKEPDCPNGEDEKYCVGLEFPQEIITRKVGFTKPPQLKHKQLPQFGQVIEQSYGVWHTKCFPRNSPPDLKEVRQICKKLGFSPYKQPSYRIIDDAVKQVVATNEWPDQRGRSFGDDEESPLAERYRSATKAVVVSKFSPLSLNEELTLFLKPSRPIAEVAHWNATDSDKCYRLEIKCM